MKIKTKRIIISFIVAFLIGFIGLNIIIGMFFNGILSIGLISVALLTWGIYELWNYKKPIIETSKE